MPIQRSASNESNPASGSGSSPTPTIREGTAGVGMDERETSGSGNAGGDQDEPSVGRGRTASGRMQLQGLGMGRPDKRPALVPNLTSPNLSTAQPSRSTLSPGRSPGQSPVHSILSEDGPISPTRPFTAAPGMSFPGTGEQTPRVGGSGSVRGMPYTAAVGSFTTPAHAQTASGGSSAARPGRGQRYNTSYNPSGNTFSTHTLQAGSGSISRSASKVRPALSGSGIGLAASAIGHGGGDADDDEHLEADRGEILIRQRQKARKQARKQKERERRMVEDGGAEASASSAGIPGESFSVQQARGTIGRSVSRSRVPSAAFSRKQGSEGYFAPSIAGTERGDQSPRDELRAPSIYSSTEDDEEDLPEREPEDIVEEVVNEVIDEETIDGQGGEQEDEDEDDASGEGDEEGLTLRDRQDAINIEHPFGLPIWKPALYRKSRSVTRNAESALHSMPSAAAERHLLPGNLLWVVLFGWWLAISCFIVAIAVSGAEVLGGGRGGYGKTLRGLAWYIGWPFGKYVEGEGAPESEHGEDEDEAEEDYGSTADGRPTTRRQRQTSDGASSVTVRGPSRNVSNTLSFFEGLPDEPRAAQDTGSTTGRQPDRREATVSFISPTKPRHENETEPLLRKPGFRRPRNRRAKMLGRIVYWPCFFFIIAPVMLFACVLCWGGVISIPMAKLTWALIELLYHRPLEINFRSAPKISVPTSSANSNVTASPDSGNGSGDTTAVEDGSPSGFTLKRARLKAGQVAPTAGPKSTVLLCTYRAVGLQYYKYTIGGVNIMFVNLLPLVFFTIIDAFLVLPAVERAEHHGQHVAPFVAFIAAPALIFCLSLASVIPLSYFIGMAVASISAQSSIGMGAVINATFGSIIEIILYSIALMQGKGRIVEGSIVGSILAGVLLMPGASMCSGALKRKEQKFNAKSAGVTSTMLIMAIIGTLTPTMFYQTYGSFHLKCTGCPEGPGGMRMNETWQCDACYYEHPDPAGDPFYQEQVKTLMYACAAILLFSYLIGLWFSLRTHASQIWQNPQQLMKPEEGLTIPVNSAMHPAHRASLTQRMTPQNALQHILPLHKAPNEGAHTSTSSSPKTGTIKLSNGGSGDTNTDNKSRDPSNSNSGLGLGGNTGQGQDGSVRQSSNYLLPAGYTPFLEGVNKDLKSSHISPMRLPSTLTTEDFTRAVAVATVSALRHQGSIISRAGSTTNLAAQKRAANVSSATAEGGHEEAEEGGGHEGPSWTRGISAGVLLACTLLYAMIAEILVDVVDVVLQGVRIDEKFLGLTLFALVPNTTEFMNAMSFAMNGNIALSMEIGSAYALQVCLLQIPAMVAFSAFYDPGKMGELVDTFTLIFPQWDVIAIILSIFLLTYTYIEARSNYHRGSILVLAYVVLIMGFYYAPVRSQGDPDLVAVDPLQAGERAGLKEALTMLWA